MLQGYGGQTHSIRHGLRWFSAFLFVQQKQRMGQLPTELVDMIMLKMDVRTLGVLYDRGALKDMVSAPVAREIEDRVLRQAREDREEHKKLLSKSLWLIRSWQSNPSVRFRLEILKRSRPLRWNEKWDKGQKVLSRISPNDASYRMIPGDGENAGENTGDFYPYIHI